MVLPLSMIIFGTQVGTIATIIPLVVATFPFIARLIENSIREVNPNIDSNIFKSMDNVNLSCVLGTKRNGVYRSFLEDYDKEK